MDRPALQRLLDDIRAGKIDVVVVYKVDRLTRSLADFAKIVEVFDAQGVSFVSVTQAFNTTSSMGRLTLNVLLSFAQFEREVTGERIRDKIAASKKKGMWMGGQPSLGYDVKDRKLLVNEAEAATVRSIFRRYLELGTVRALRDDLAAGGVVSKRRTAADGSPYGGQKFSRGALYAGLVNDAQFDDFLFEQTQAPTSKPLRSGRARQSDQFRLRRAVENPRPGGVGVILALHRRLEPLLHHAVGMRGHHMRRPEPCRQRQFRPMHRRAGGERGLPSAIEAFQQARTALQGHSASFSARGTNEPVRPAS